MAKFKGKQLNKHERHELKQAKKNKIMATVIIVIFAFSLFAVFLYKDDVPGAVKLGGYTFGQKRVDNYYVWQIISGPNKDYIGTEFYYVPDENYKENFESEKILNLLDAPAIFLSIDPIYNTTEEAQALAIQDLARLEIKNMFPDKNVINSVETDFEDSLVFGCQNATESTPVINFIDSSENQGIHINEKNPNCINIISTTSTIMKYVDMIKFAIIENE